MILFHSPYDVLSALLALFLLAVAGVALPTALGSSYRRLERGAPRWPRVAAGYAVAAVAPVLAAAGDRWRQWRRPAPVAAVYCAQCGGPIERSGGRLTHTCGRTA